MVLTIEIQNVTPPLLFLPKKPLEYQSKINSKPMKKALLFLFVATFGLLNAQNQAPQIAITNVLADTVAKTITVNFNATDAENDPLEISAYLSADSGYAHVANVLAVTGDVGFPISAGNNLSLTITYTDAALFQAAGQNNQGWVGVKLVASDLQAVPVADLLQGIDSASVYNDMLFIAQPRYHTNQAATLGALKDSLQTRFNRYELQTQRLNFNYGNVVSQNIIGRQAGSELEEKVVVIDGHFDAVNNSPGADDNGSAVAGVLAAARVLSQYHFKKSINYLGFDKEEQGLLGSANYVNNGIKPFEDIEGVLNMEMIGYYDNANNSQQIPFGFSQLFPEAVDSISTSGNKGIFLFVVGNTNSNSLATTFDSVARTYVPGVRSLVLAVPGNGQIAPDLRRSDHAPFWDAGYNALMLTDGADFRNANYHTPGDSLGTLNIPFLVRNIKAMVATAAILAEPVSADVDQTIVGQLLQHMPMSLSEIDLAAQINVFPNPSTGEVFIRFAQHFDRVKINIVDATGKVVTSNTITVEAGEDYAMHVEVAGMYFLEVESQGMLVTRKFVVTEGHRH